MTIPRILNQRYELQERLSQKNDRWSYHAIDSQTGRSVMLKLLVFSSETSWESIRLFEREVAVLKSLDYPTIPEYLDTFEFDFEQLKGFALVQEFINCRSLEEHLEQGRVLSEPEIIQIATSLLETLDYLHHMNPPVIHRDIKPSNILLGDRSAHSVGDLFLVDFGAVQTTDTQGKHTMTIVGTYGFMPPEQFGGRSSPASDLYSLGATLLYLITGKLPSELINDDLELILPNPLGVSVHLENWLRRMLKAAPSQRPSSARDAYHYLKMPQTIQPIQQTFAITQDKCIDIYQSNHKLEIYVRKKFRSKSIDSYIFKILFVLISASVFSGISWMISTTIWPYSFAPFLGQLALSIVTILLLSPLWITVACVIIAIVKFGMKYGEIYTLIIQKEVSNLWIYKNGFLVVSLVIRGSPEHKTDWL
jgi:serine/threonine protein kinase